MVEMKITNETTLQEAKDFLTENWKTGAKCPCCRQLVKQYRRLFDSGLARFLIALYNLDRMKPNEYFDKDRIREMAGLDQLKATNYGIIDYWKVAEKMPNEDDSKRTSGLWRITPLGRQFVEGNIFLPKYALTYNNKGHGFSEETLSISFALGKHFNYAELMNA